MNLLAVDPGNTESGWVLLDTATYRPLEFGKDANADVLRIVRHHAPVCARVALEMVASYGMPIGVEVFETVLWTGRYMQMSLDTAPHTSVDLVYRRDVKLHHTGSARAKDANITQALVDRFAPGQPNRGKGTKANPGWFYQFRADIWQAYALAVYVADTTEGQA